MPPQYVKPYVKTNKNDMNDAEASAEAVVCPTMRFVSIKSEFQQELTQLHRARERLVKSRTGLVNELRGFFTEYGVVLAQGRNKLAGRVQEVLLDDKYQLPEMCKRSAQRFLDELSKLEDEIEYYEKEISLVAKSQPSCQQLMTISGVGELSATAVIAAVGNVENFKNGRQFEAFLGLVPRQLVQAVKIASVVLASEVTAIYANYLCRAHMPCCVMSVIRRTKGVPGYVHCVSVVALAEQRWQ